MSKQKKQLRGLPSGKYVRYTCPHCGGHVTYPMHRGQDRHEYLIVTPDEPHKCPLCLEEIEWEFRYIPLPPKN